MSLPERRHPSHSQLSTTPYQHLPCASPTDQEAQMSPKQVVNPLQTPTKAAAAMSQATTDSSPLSTVPSSSPESTAPPASGSPTQLLPKTPGSPTKDGLSTLVGDVPANLGSAVEPITLTHPSTTPTTPSTTMAKKRATKPVIKRNREDDKEEGSPPSKKTTTSSNAGAKVPAKPAPRKPAVKKTVPRPPAPSTRPSRDRKAPERFENLATAKPLKGLPLKKTTRVFDPDYITTVSTSRLGKADVYHMLLEPAAWSSLSTEQQATLVSMLPPSSMNTSLLATIKSRKTETTRPQAFTMSNDCFRTDVAKFQQDLRNGHLAKTWQAAAEQAVIARAAGKYDAWKAEEAELWWGQKSNSTAK